MEKGVCNRYCFGCIYHREMSGYTGGCCNYIFITGKPRPCLAGKGCTVKETRKRGRKKKVEVENGNS